jgi:hypothetical protein
MDSIFLVDSLNFIMCYALLNAELGQVSGMPTSGMIP